MVGDQVGDQSHAVLAEHPDQRPQARLAAQLSDAFPGIAVHHIEQRCMYEFVGPVGNQRIEDEESAGGHAAGDQPQEGRE